MATLKPFAALRPDQALAPQICELPYDVMSSDEARELAKDNPLSFLHVSKPEIDLPRDTDAHSSTVYAKGKENFERLISNGALRRDRVPSYYLYRQIMGAHSQVGLVATASCDEYLANTIRKHELTRPDKEDDRVRHIETLNAQTGPVFLTYRAQQELDRWIPKRILAPPDVDFTAADDVRHTSWSIRDEADVTWITARFAEIDALYIADGHHRSAAAARVHLKRRETQHAGGSATFLSVIFPHNQMQILPYNRLVKDLNGLDAEALLQRLTAVFAVAANGRPSPSQKHEISMYLRGKWHSLSFRPAFTAATDPAETLDVTLLQKHVLDPLLGITDPRTSARLSFVGGIRGTAELEKPVNSGEYACAFSMFPTKINDLMTIADAGGLMPPKSTWFEPKLRDGMFCHLLSPHQS